MLLREPPDRERMIRRAHLAPWVVLVSTLALSLIVGIAVHTLNEDRWQSRFDTLVRDAAARVELRMAEYETVVRTARAFYAAAGPVAGSPEFLRGLEIDLRFGGVFDLEWAAPASTPDESARLEAMHRAATTAAAISAPLALAAERLRPVVPSTTLGCQRPSGAAPHLTVRPRHSARPSCSTASSVSRGWPCRA